MDIRICNPLDFPGWDDALIPMRDHSIFHTTFWARVLIESYGYRPRYFAAMEGEKLKAVIPVMEVRSFLTGRRGVSLPFTDFCEPLVCDGASRSSLNETVIRHGKESGWRSVEWRGGVEPFRNARPSTSFFRHTVRLTNRENGLESSLRSSTRRNIRKATREGVEVSLSHGLEAVEQFYRLNCVTRRDHGLPPQPFSFFRKIYEHIVSGERGFVALAKYKGKTIAGAVYFHFGKNAIYKFGASDKRHQELRANNLVMWEAIRWLQSRGFESLSLGRTEPDNKGLLQFKRGWNTEEEIVRYYRFNLSTERFTQSELLPGTTYTRFARAMPIPILRMIGAAMYRHVG